MTNTETMPSHPATITSRSENHLKTQNKRIQKIGVISALLGLLVLIPSLTLYEVRLRYANAGIAGQTFSHWRVRRMVDRHNRVASESEHTVVQNEIRNLKNEINTLHKAAGTSNENVYQLFKNLLAETQSLLQSNPNTLPPPPKHLTNTNIDYWNTKLETFLDTLTKTQKNKLDTQLKPLRAAIEGRKRINQNFLYAKQTLEKNKSELYKKLMNLF